MKIIRKEQGLVNAICLNNKTNNNIYNNKNSCNKQHDNYLILFVKFMYLVYQNQMFAFICLCQIQ